MARKGNPISVRLGLNRSSSSSWFSDYYYGKLVYQDINLRSYFASIRQPTRLTFGFRLGRSIIIHFQKRTVIHFFIPRSPRRKKKGEKSRRERKKKYAMKIAQWWEFGKVGKIECLSETSFSSLQEEGKKVLGFCAGKRVESIMLDDQKKKNEIRIWKKKKQGYGYHDRSTSIKNHLSSSLRGSGELKQPKYAEVLNNIEFMIEKKESFKKTKLFFFFFKKTKYSYKKKHQSHPLKRTLAAVRPSFNYLVMQYLFNTKNKIHFDPVSVRHHFVEPGVLETSQMNRIRLKERNCLQRIRSRIAFFVERSNSEKKDLTEEKKSLTHFIRKKNDLRFEGDRKNNIQLFPFFGATFFFPRDGVRVNSKEFPKNARERIDRKCWRKCWNLMGKDKVMKLIEKFIDNGGIRELIKGVEMMIEIILKNRRIPYGYNSYLNEVKKMRSFLANRTKTSTLIESKKIKSVYQSASPIAQDISVKPKNKRRSFRKIFSQIVKNIPLVMKKGVEGIRISCSGRLEGAEIARTECGKYGKTSCNVLDQKIDYASAEVSTRYGILGVKVWISYSQK
uniref:Small ribosomal subunit protein uS3m n=1 Tax=Myrtillocactus geometrizans TaxID=336127 RepID=I4DEG4_9CARY|nr:ribosomal protein S3 [Myrtillocactus geometrizans]